MPRKEHIGVLDIGLLDRRDFVGRRNIEEMGAVIYRIAWIGIHRIERDLIFFNIWIVERFLIVKMAGNFLPRRKAFF